jgi:hypothetical protein
MKQTTIILFVLLQTFYSYGQVVRFDDLSFDLSMLDNRNEYRESRYDTVVFQSGDYKDEYLYNYGKSIYASKNHDYFVVSFDTTCVAPLEQETACDSPSETDYYFYHKNSLLWKKHFTNSIGKVHFFEDDGSLIITWADAWVENFHLFYDRQGNILDTIPIDEEIYALDNDQVLLYYKTDSINRVKCLGSSNREIWRDVVHLKAYESRNFFDVSGNGSRFILVYRDTIYSYNSSHKLLWKRYSNNFGVDNYLSYSGKYLIKKVFKPNDETYIYDNQSSKLIKKIDTIYYNNSSFVPKYCNMIYNSDYLFFENLLWDIGKCDMVITDIMGNVILFKSYPLRGGPMRIEYDKGFKLYNSKLMETIKYKP